MNITGLRFIIYSCLFLLFWLIASALLYTFEPKHHHHKTTTTTTTTTSTLNTNHNNNNIEQLLYYNVKERTSSDSLIRILLIVASSISMTANLFIMIHYYFGVNCCGWMMHKTNHSITLTVYNESDENDENDMTSTCDDDKSSSSSTLSSNRSVNNNDQEHDETNNIVVVKHKSSKNHHHHEVEDDDSENVACCVCCQSWVQRIKNLLFPKRNLQTRLIFYISVVDTVRCVAFLMTLVHVSVAVSADTTMDSTARALKLKWAKYLCFTQAFLVQFSSLAIVLWTNIYCCFIYVESEVFQPLSKSIVRCEWMFHLFVWPCAILTAIAAQLMNINGSSAPVWCWISHPRLGFSFFYIPLLLVFLTNLLAQAVVLMVQWYRMWKRWRRMTRGTGLEEGAEHPEVSLLAMQSAHPISFSVAWQLRLFLLAFMTTWIFGLVFRIINLFMTYKPPEWLGYVHSTLLPLNGFLNFLAYLVITRGGAIDWIVFSVRLIWRLLSCLLNCRPKQRKIKSQTLRKPNDRTSLLHSNPNEAKQPYAVPPNRTAIVPASHNKSNNSTLNRFSVNPDVFINKSLISSSPKPNFRLYGSTIRSMYMNNNYNDSHNNGNHNNDEDSTNTEDNESITTVTHDENFIDDVDQNSRQT